MQILFHYRISTLNEFASQAVIKGQTVKHATYLITYLCKYIYTENQ